MGDRSVPALPNKRFEPAPRARIWPMTEEAIMPIIQSGKSQFQTETSGEAPGQAKGRKVIEVRKIRVLFICHCEEGDFPDEAI